MYFVAERQENKDLKQFSKVKKLKVGLLNIYILIFVVFDLLLIKKKAFEEGILSLTGLYVLLGYFFIAEAYGLYFYLYGKSSPQKKTLEQISWFGTIFRHVYSFLKICLFGVGLSSSQNQYLYAYFMVRFTIYASTFFLIFSHLRVVLFFVLNKGELQSVLKRRIFFYKKDAMWQLANFHKIFYASLLGISVDVLSFGNDISYYCWIGMTILWSLYEFNKFMSKNCGWNKLKNIFEAE